MIQKLNTIVAIGALSMSLLANSSTYAHCGGCGHDSARKDIVETAVASGNFETLVTAVRAAGLVQTLKSDGPFTLFAPTDEAFGKLPKGTIKTLLSNPDRLAAILKHHVVLGRSPRHGPRGRPHRDGHARRTDHAPLHADAGPRLQRRQIQADRPARPRRRHPRP